nr:hypothetical protein [Tanacetum cinerariifolium]
MQIMKNKLKSMNILENKLESLKLQENQPVDGLYSLPWVLGLYDSWRTTSPDPQGHAKASYGTIFIITVRYVCGCDENHHEEEDHEENNSSKIKILPLFPIHGGSHHDFFGAKASDLSSDHSVGGNWYRADVKPEGSIAEGYVAEEALIFCSHYFQDVTMKVNRPDRNVDPPPPTCQFQIRQRHVDKDPGVSASSELFALACGPTSTPILVNSCVFNDVRFVMHNHDERRTTQKNSICSPGGKDGDINEGCKVKHLVLRNNMTQIWEKGELFKDDQYILTTQVKQVFYLEDTVRRPPNWKVVEHVNHKKFSNGGVIVVEDDPDVIHFDNSYDFALSASLNDLDFATLHIDGQSLDVDAPLDIIDVDEDDDIIDDEDALPHDLAYSDDEDLVNVDDDDMSADVARGHDGDRGGDDRPPSHQVPISCGRCLGNRGKGTQKPNLSGRKAGSLHTRQKTRKHGLKKITDLHGLILIQFEWNDRETLIPLSDHAAHWANYLGELVRELPMHYPSWR